MKKKSERKEAWMRIPVLIISGIIFALWIYLVYALIIVNFLAVLFTGKRHKGMAELAEIWNTHAYGFVKYMAFLTNERPFPFSNLKKSMSKFE